MENTKVNIIVRILYIVMFVAYSILAVFAVQTMQPTYTYWVKGYIENMPFEVIYEKNSKLTIDKLEETLFSNMDEGYIHEYEIRKNGIPIRGRKIIRKIDWVVD